MKLNNFLNAKPLYYDEIDYTRMPRIYESVKSYFNVPKTIHIIGTNGKGTTGRFLASALYSLGYKVGHYTSPHILDFNERIWLDGEDIASETLESAHKKLQTYLHVDDSDSLSYFEYTTLLSMIVYKDCDYVVMEAGLGGEHDATAVFPKVLTLVTPIALDHEAFLGSTIKEIATTKLNAIQNNAIVAVQHNDEVCEIAKTLDKNIYRLDKYLNNDDLKNITEISKELDLAPYLSENLALSISALNFLKLKYKTADFNSARLFGRLTNINDRIIVDVGHNVLAAKSIVSALSGDKYIIIYNSYKDKNYKEILEILKPISLHVEVIEINETRIEDLKLMKKTLNDLGIKNSLFKKIKQDKKYLVFGSFSVVECFLNKMMEN